MDDEYESLPQNSTPQTHMLAGAAAGILEHCVMYPVDCVKTRMQVLVPDPRATYRNMADAFYQIIRHEGVRMTLRGINVTAYGAGPAHALYFASYEQVKKLLYRSNSNNHLVHGVAGCCATLLHDAVMNPAEVIKQRMQLYNSPFRTSRECAVYVLRTEGLRAFYRSYSTQLTMNIPFQSLHFILYELGQDLMNKDRSYSPTTHILSGAFAGGVAAGATTPLDVCKTLLNTQQSCAYTRGTSHISGTSHSSSGTSGTLSGSSSTLSGTSGTSRQQYITGLGEAFRTVYRFRGIAGFFSGFGARVIYQMPSTAISWSVYEFFKFILTDRNSGGSTDGGSGFVVGSGSGDEFSKMAGSTVNKVQLHVAVAAVATASVGK